MIFPCGLILILPDFPCNSVFLSPIKKRNIAQQDLYSSMIDFSKRVACRLPQYSLLRYYAIIQYTKLQRSVVLIFRANLIPRNTCTFIHTQWNTLTSGGPLQSNIIKLLWGFFSRKFTTTTTTKMSNVKSGVCSWVLNGNFYLFIFSYNYPFILRAPVRIGIWKTTREDEGWNRCNTQLRSKSSINSFRESKSSWASEPCLHNKKGWLKHKD